MKVFNIYILLFLIISCSMPASRLPKRLDTQDYFGGSGVVGYFLPDVPEWAMVSESGQCLRSKRIKFLDIPILRQSFALSYSEAHQMQLMYNLELEKKIKIENIPLLSFKEEEILFYQVLNQISANFQVFKAPTFKIVNVIWVDLALNDKMIYERLKKLVHSPTFEMGHPVFISSCLSQNQLEKIGQELGVGSADIRYISYEMMSMFDIKNRKIFQFGLDLSQFFNKDQKVILWTPYSDTNKAFVGSTQNQKY